MREKFYHRVLMLIHLFNWTGRHDKLGELIKVLGTWSYNQTNSNEGVEYDDEENFNNFKDAVERIIG
jgi:hypothetical protein